MCVLVQILGKKDILATLHPGAPEAESSSLGKETRKTLGVLRYRCLLSLCWLSLCWLSLCWLSLC